MKVDVRNSTEEGWKNSEVIKIVISRIRMWLV